MRFNLQKLTKRDDKKYLKNTINNYLTKMNN